MPPILATPRAFISPDNLFDSIESFEKNSRNSQKDETNNIKLNVNITYVKKQEEEKEDEGK